MLLSVNTYIVPVLLEEEADVYVEGSVTILLVEATCILECHDEVLVHDEAKTSTS